jgi:hypothetical protein
VKKRKREKVKRMKNRKYFKITSEDLGSILT